MIEIKNPTLGLIYYITLFVVAVYVIGYTVFYNKGYQFQEALVANTMVKMKGSAHTPDMRVFDSYDMVVPPILPDAAFIGTSFILTPNQTHGSCPGIDANLEICDCPQHDGNVTLCCPAGHHTENGMFTGVCSSDGVHCEMAGWCPFETKPLDPDENVLIGIEDWTLFARVNGRFPRYNILTSNTESNPDMSAPNNLTLWSMGGIIEKSGYTFHDYAKKGGVIMANFVYNCNLDHDITECEPEITFNRLDNPEDPVSSGFNFRYIQTSRDFVTGEVARDLWKLYGIYVVFTVYGQGGKFDLATLSVTLGAGAAFFSFAALACDLVLQYVLPGRERLIQEKIRQFTFDQENLESQDYKESLLTNGQN